MKEETKIDWKANQSDLEWCWLGGTMTEKIVGKIIYVKPKKLLAESQTTSLSLKHFISLIKIVQDYQSWSPQDTTVQIPVYRDKKNEEKNSIHKEWNTIQVFTLNDIRLGVFFLKLLPIVSFVLTKIEPMPMTIWIAKTL